MNRPYFSICIPAYNCGGIINEAFVSVASQSFDDWEVVVADDGSHDDTAEICQGQSVIPPEKYTFIRTDHSGLLDTRRQLLAIAKGAVIVSLDADDALCDTDALAKIHSMMSSTGCDFVMFNATRSLATMERFIDYKPLECNEEGLADFHMARQLFCRSYSLNNIATKAYRRDLMSYEGLDISVQMTEDRLQSLQLFLHGCSCGLIDEPIYFYRPSEGSMTEGTFKLTYVKDQLYVEQQVDTLRDVIEEPRELGCNLAAWVLAVDLLRVHQATKDKAQEFDSYQKLYRAWADTPYFDAEIPKDVRADRRIAYNLFKHRRFATLRAFLGVCAAAKRLDSSKTSCNSGRSRVRS
jgi:glycosyltransferase involved in cell wall biosynthesis